MWFVKGFCALASSAVLMFLGWYLFVHEAPKTVEPDIPNADTPPPEYLYLDTARALAYLGQIEGGLSADEKRTFGATQSNTANLTAGAAASISVTNGTERGLEQTVAPKAADRFYRLLRLLLADRKHQLSGATGKRSDRWLTDLNAEVDTRNPKNKLVKGIHEGRFVRLENARLCLPTYASVFPRVGQVPMCATERSPPKAPPHLHGSATKLRRTIDAYRARLGANPRLPFVVRQAKPATGEAVKGGVTFFIPTGYNSLVREPSLLSGRATVVAKVVYNQLAGSAAPKQKLYRDRPTLQRYIPALRHLPRRLRHELKVGAVAGAVKRSVTLKQPVVVLVPVAIYE